MTPWLLVSFEGAARLLLMVAASFDSSAFESDACLGYSPPAKEVVVFWAAAAAASSSRLLESRKESKE